MIDVVSHLIVIFVSGVIGFIVGTALAGRRMEKLAVSAGAAHYDRNNSMGLRFFKWGPAKPVDRERLRHDIIRDAERRFSEATGGGELFYRGMRP